MNETKQARWLRAIAALAATALIAIGCASDGESDIVGGGETESSTDETTEGDTGGSTSTTAPPSTTESTSTTELLGEAAVDLSDAAPVVVTNQGAEPRVELRNQIDPGQMETMLLVQTQSVRQVINGQESPSPGEVPIVMRMDLSAESRGGSLLTYRSVISEVSLGDGIDPGVAAQIQPNLDPMVGITTTAIVDDRGRVLSTMLEGLAGIDPTVASTVEQMTTSSQFAHPLPEEPVGVGATWEIDQLLPVNGLEVTQTTAYEVLSIEGSIVELGIGTSQTVAAGSEMQAGGASATVVDWESISSGSITLDLTSMVPATMSQLFASQTFEFGPGAEKTTLEQTIETTIEITAG